MATISLRLPDEVAERLEKLSSKTNRPKSYYLKEMLGRYLDEYEDAYLALERFNDQNKKFMTSEELESKLGL